MAGISIEKAFKNSADALASAMEESLTVLFRLKDESDPVAESMQANSKNISATKAGLRSIGRDAEGLRQNLPGIAPKQADATGLQEEIPTLAGETPQM